jgi:hypothetical protein
LSRRLAELLFLLSPQLEHRECQDYKGLPERPGLKGLPEQPGLKGLPEQPDLKGLLARQILSR